MRLTSDQFAGLSDRLAKGGFSVNTETGGAPKVGYMVSLPGTEERHRTVNATPAQVEEYARKHAAVLGQPGRFFGGWKTGSGDSVLDVSRQVKPSGSISKKYGKSVAQADAATAAMDLSVAYNQEAVYDLGKDREIANRDYVPPKKPKKVKKRA
jgi:hypothetical protein